ncbi:MAG TPA: hypothetical protein VK369_13915 [Segetibacter sp.]|jgi:hypothetical protein|nr:hypothetical protein [Segetibacter sp.]
MEVHHTSLKENKKFKEYLLEGFMIFIAVTLGFFADSLRERIYNNEREDHYINSLIENLEQDATFLKQTITQNQRKLNGLDSLLSLTTKGFLPGKDRRLLYTYSQHSVSFYSGFLSNDATMMQLKNAGGLQYIHSHYIADSIAKYDFVIRNVYAAEAEYAKATNDAMDAASEILIFKVRNHPGYFKNGVYTNNVPLLTTDPGKMEIFFNKIWIERGWTQNYIVNLKNTLQFATRLIQLLKKEYGKD